VPPGPALDSSELTRYSRHLLLPELGEEGQRRLKGSRVAIVGMGGLGCPAALYLTAAGVGELSLIDADRVDASNLQRQILYAEADVGRAKVDAARERLAAVNPHTRIVAHPLRLTAGNALEVLRGHDVVIDGTDNFATRYLVNDAGVLLGVPNVHGSVLRFEGRVSVFGTPAGPCYRCLFPSPPPPELVPDCADAGVLGVMPGLIGVLQATETIKWLTGAGDSLAGRLLLIDTLRLRFQTVALRRDPGCPACGTRELTALIDYDAFCGVPDAAGGVEAITPAELAMRLTRARPPLMIDVREPWEWGIGHLDGALLMPLGRIDEFLGTLRPDDEVVVYCHRGARSLAAAQRLVDAGFARVSHLEGGIERWSAEVDPALPRY
jgi:adenylyltransferase/sulfurtransferase